MLRKLPFVLLRLTGVPFLFREVLQKNKVSIILFHDIDPDIIETYLRTLIPRYNFISLQDYISAREAGTVDELPPRSMIITLDDGHKSNYELKPLLEKYKVPATIFLCSGIVDTNRHFWWKHETGGEYGREHLKSMPNQEKLEVLKQFGFEVTKEFGDRQALLKSEIEDMEDMVDFQSHTVFHPILPMCTDEEAEWEIAQSKKDLEEKYGFSINTLSYPNGDYSKRDIELARKAGYTCAITIEPGFNSADTDLFRLKRAPIRDGADVNELLVKASGVWWYLRKMVGQ
ncbi:polysaccharide deacetylase family protein [Methanococcoides sp. FTZ1]|uniref:polysaccharide deacetylase family protein n=1 Tax=Methanococcoides sp. FTZ1 TaxID=3439061 RepID=UPI003F860546